MHPVAWDPVSVSRQWNTELYQALVMTWEIGWGAAVIVSEVRTVLLFFPLFSTVNQKEVLIHCFLCFFGTGQSREQGRMIDSFKTFDFFTFGASAGVL